MGTIRLTNKAALALAATGADCFWWDQDLSGFGLKVTSAGTKSFIVQYRMGGRGAPTRRFTIGKLGTWDAAKARIEAERLLRLVATGNDPRQAERDRKRAHIDFAFPRYVESFLSIYGKRAWRPRTYETRSSDLKKWVVPILKGKALQEIRKRDVVDVLDALPAEHPSLPRNVFAVTRKLFAWAVERDDLERSPCESIKRPRPVPPRTRILTDQELMYVAACSFDLGMPFGPFVRTLLVTGQRRDEVAGMRWEEIDARARLWTLPKERSKNHREHKMPLSELAMWALEDMAGGERFPKKGLVFKTNGRTTISGFARMKGRLDKIIADTAKGETPAPWRLHDLRRSVATNLQRLGIRFEVTEALLNHVGAVSRGVGPSYLLHDWAPEMREAIDKWDARIRGMTAQFAADHTLSAEAKVAASTTANP